MADFSNPVIHLYQWRNDDELNGGHKDLFFVPIKELKAYPYLRNINSLDLSFNYIELLPKDFAPVMAHLKKLNLSYNNIRYLPDNFGLMNSLTTFDCRSNLINRLPVSFGDLTALIWLDLSKNPLVPSLRQACGNAPWTPEVCMKAAGVVVDLIRQVREIRQKELRIGVLFGARELPPQVHPVLSPRLLQQKMQSSESIPNTGTDDQDQEPTVSPETTTSGVTLSRNFPEMCEEEAEDTAPTPIVPAPTPAQFIPARNVRVLRPEDPNAPFYMYGLVMNQAQVQAEVVEYDSPDWRAKSLSGFFFLTRVLMYLFGTSVVLALAVDQTLVDAFLMDTFGSYLPSSILYGFSSAQSYVQDWTNLSSSALPFFKAPPKVNYIWSFFQFISEAFCSAFQSAFSFYTSRQWA